MKNFVKQTVLFLLYAYPSLSLALYLEYTHFIETGLIVSVILNFFLAFFTWKYGTMKIFFAGNILKLFSNLILFHYSIEHLSFSLANAKISVFLATFFICWVIPQAFGLGWGKIFHKAKIAQPNTSA